ncbi:MAG: lipoyl(octanoyl) transferase LipB [Flavobacteriales bacterium]|nr:lipoyl(octanoyl) transferase LipB [Flavobacteriales bacterium]
MSFTLITLEPTGYLDALMLQENFFNAQLEKKAKGKKTNNTLILLQHTPVYTLGKSGDAKNLKVPISETGAEFFKTKRGGDITFHGPGQLVAYPIFDIDSFKMNTRQYVETLEQCIIDCIAEYGLIGTRISEASGVWLDADGENPRKICAVGLKISRHISMHGFAFNINTDLSFFDNIVPCGLEDKAVTSLSKELGKEMDFYAVQEKILSTFTKYFQ